MSRETETSVRLPPEGETPKVGQDEVEEAVLREADRVGPGEVGKAAIVKRFMGRGVSRATLFRWVDTALASGKVAKRIKTKAKAAGHAAS